jgi:hypothetical protein
VIRTAAREFAVAAASGLSTHGALRVKLTGYKGEARLGIDEVVADGERD